MKILMSNPDKTLGFILPESNTIQEIGLFDTQLIEAQIAALQAFKVFAKEHGVGIVKIATMDKGNAKCLAMRPEGADGEAWVVLAPRVED